MAYIKKADRTKVSKANISRTKFAFVEKELQPDELERNSGNNSGNNGGVFDISEWCDARTFTKIAERHGLMDPNKMRVTLIKNSKKPGVYRINLYFKSKIYKMLDSSMSGKLIVLQHRADPARLLITQSSNGYVVSKATGTATPSWFFGAQVKLENYEFEKFKDICEPIFHEKGVNSGTIIELDLRKHLHECQITK